jgi:hypothetical protein
MTISTESTRVEFTGDGATLPFAVPYKFLDKTDLVVVLRTIATGVEAVQTIYTHYTVLGAGLASGTVTFVTAPPATQKVVIYNDPPLTQLVDYISGGTFPAETHEEALDRLTIQQKRTREIATRTPSLGNSDTDGSGAYDANNNDIDSVGVLTATKVTGLTAPTATTDATTKTYVDAEINNAGLTTPTGLIATGGVTSRTLADRWGDVASIKDFGAAVGDGSTDDTTTFNNLATFLAANPSTAVALEAGKTYKLTTAGATLFFNNILGNGATVLLPNGTQLDKAGAARFRLEDVKFVTVGNKSNAAGTIGKTLYTDAGSRIHDSVYIKNVTYTALTTEGDSTSWSDDANEARSKGCFRVETDDCHIENVTLWGVGLGIVIYPKTAGISRHYESNITGYNVETLLWLDGTGAAASFSHGTMERLRITNTAAQQAYWINKDTGSANNGKDVVLSSIEHVSGLDIRDVRTDYVIERSLYLQDNETRVSGVFDNYPSSTGATLKFSVGTSETKTGGRLSNIEMRGGVGLGFSGNSIYGQSDYVLDGFLYTGTGIDSGYIAVDLSRHNDSVIMRNGVIREASVGFQISSQTFGAHRDVLIENVSLVNVFGGSATSASVLIFYAGPGAFTYPAVTGLTLRNVVSSLSSGPDITAATRASPVVVTAVGHGHDNGHIVLVTGVVGMTEINSGLFTVTNKTADTFELYDRAGTPAPINGAGYGAYVSGGHAQSHEINNYALDIGKMDDVTLERVRAPFSERPFDSTGSTNVRVVDSEFEYRGIRSISNAWLVLDNAGLSAQVFDFSIYSSFAPIYGSYRIGFRHLNDTGAMVRCTDHWTVLEYDYELADNAALYIQLPAAFSQGVRVSGNFSGNSFTDATCDTTNTSVTVTMDSTAALRVGMAVSGAGIPDSATVATIGVGTFNLSVAATATATNATLTFTDRGSIEQAHHEDLQTDISISGSGFSHSSFAANIRIYVASNLLIVRRTSTTMQGGRLSFTVTRL